MRNNISYYVFITFLNAKLSSIHFYFAKRLFSIVCICYNRAHMEKNQPTAAQTVLFFHSHQRDRGPAEEKLRGIYRFARACNWKITVLEEPRSPAEVRSQIKAWNPVGCIVDMNESSRYFTSASLCSIPTAFLDFDDRQSNGKTFRVNHNPDAIGTLAAKHLSSLGVKDFAFVGYTHEWSWSEARMRYFRKHLGKTARSFTSFEFPAGTVVPAGTRKRFIKWLSSLPVPCGMLLADDGLGGVVYPACAMLDIKIPDDVAILGVDDNERFCTNLNPPLSSILLDFRQAGWMVAELLHRAIHNPTLSPFVMTYNPLGIAPRKSTALKISRDNPIAQKARKLISELATSGANVDAIARHFTCSRRLLEMRFREATGVSLLDAIRNVRLEQACRLLRDSNQAIGTIALQCGYASESALKTNFKKRLGMTMSRWRKSQSLSQRQAT